MSDDCLRLSPPHRAATCRRGRSSRNRFGSPAPCRCATQTALPQGFVVAKISSRQSLNPGEDSRLGTVISQPGDPLIDHVCAGLRDVITHIHHRMNCNLYITEKQAGYSCDTFAKAPRGSIIYNRRKVSSNHNASNSLLCTSYRRRHSRSSYQYRGRRQVRSPRLACLQPDLLGNHSYQMEPAAARPRAERTLSARLSQSSAVAGHRHRR